MDTSQLGVTPDQGLPEMLLDTDDGDKEMSEIVGEPSAENNTAESVDLPASLLIPTEGDTPTSPQDVPSNERGSPPDEDKARETSDEKADSSQSETNSSEQRNSTPTESETLPESSNNSVDENMEVETQSGTHLVNESLPPPPPDNQLETQTPLNHDSTIQNTESTNEQSFTDISIPSETQESNSPSNLQDIPPIDVAPPTHEPISGHVGHSSTPVEGSGSDRSDEDERVVTSEVVQPNNEEAPQDGQQVSL